MSDLCKNCGAQIPEDAAFCPECGTAVSREDAGLFAPASTANPETTAKPVEKQTAPANFLDDVKEEGGLFSAVQAQPAEKKPMPKGVKIGLIAAAAVIVLLFALSKILTAVNSPEKISEKFFAAMEASDVAALSKVMEIEVDEDEAKIELTVENMAPFFKLYSESSKYRSSLEALMEDHVEKLSRGKETSDGGMNIYMMAEENILFTKHVVMLQRCDAEVFTNYDGAEVTLGNVTAVAEYENFDSSANAFAEGSTDDYIKMINGGVAEFDDIIPGIYDISVKFTSETGDEFTAQASADIHNDDKYIDLTAGGCYSMCVYNNSDYVIDVTAGAAKYTVAPYEEVILGPVAGDTLVTAGYVTSKNEVLELKAMPSETDYLCFELCSLDVWNYSNADVSITVDGVDYGTVIRDDFTYLYPLQYGATVKFEAVDMDFLAPYEYIVEYSSDTAYPYFTLSDTAAEALSQLVKDEIHAAVDAYSAMDPEALKQYIDYDICYELYDILEYSNELYEITIEVTEVDLGGDVWWNYLEDGSVVVFVDMEYYMNITQDGEAFEGSEYQTVGYTYADGVWSRYIEPAEAE